MATNSSTAIARGVANETELIQTALARSGDDPASVLATIRIQISKEPGTAERFMRMLAFTAVNLDSLNARTANPSNYVHELGEFLDSDAVRIDEAQATGRQSLPVPDGGEFAGVIDWTLGEGTCVPDHWAVAIRRRDGRPYALSPLHDDIKAAIALHAGKTGVAADETVIGIAGAMRLRVAGHMVIDEAIGQLSPWFMADMGPQRLAGTYWTRLLLPGKSPGVASSIAMSSRITTGIRSKLKLVYGGNARRAESAIAAATFLHSGSLPPRTTLETRQELFELIAGERWNLFSERMREITAFPDAVPDATVRDYPPAPEKVESLRPRSARRPSGEMTRSWLMQTGAESPIGRVYLDRKEQRLVHLLGEATPSRFSNSKGLKVHVSSTEVGIYSERQRQGPAVAVPFNPNWRTAARDAAGIHYQVLKGELVDVTGMFVQVPPREVAALPAFVRFAVDEGYFGAGDLGAEQVRLNESFELNGPAKMDRAPRRGPTDTGQSLG